LTINFSEKPAKHSSHNKKF